MSRNPTNLSGNSDTKKTASGKEEGKPDAAQTDFSTRLYFQRTIHKGNPAVGGEPKIPGRVR